MHVGRTTARSYIISYTLLSQRAGMIWTGSPHATFQGIICSHLDLQINNPVSFKWNPPETVTLSLYDETSMKTADFVSVLTPKV